MNSISNGAFFQIAARLARYTGNSTYVDWAEKIWDWSSEIGLIDEDYNVYDGTDDTINCTEIDHDSWSYEPAVYIYGTSILYNYTNGSSMWEKRTTGLLQAANRTFFSPYKNATDIMYEKQCEPTNSCDNDQFSFKAYLSRWLAKTTIVAPYTEPLIQPLLSASAKAAAQSCSGQANGTVCGQKWYVGGYDGSWGIGQYLSALETIQGLLVSRAPNVQTSKTVHIAKAPTSTTSLPTASPTPAANRDVSSLAGKAGVGKAYAFTAAFAIFMALMIS